MNLIIDNDEMSFYFLLIILFSSWVHTYIESIHIPYSLSSQQTPNWQPVKRQFIYFFIPIYNQIRFDCPKLIANMVTAVFFHSVIFHDSYQHFLLRARV